MTLDWSLSISSRIAHQHEGYIEASNTGLGVTFTVYLPPLQHDDDPG